MMDELPFPAAALRAPARAVQKRPAPLRRSGAKPGRKRPKPAPARVVDAAGGSARGASSRGDRMLGSVGSTEFQRRLHLDEAAAAAEFARMVAQEQEGQSGSLDLSGFNITDLAPLESLTHLRGLLISTRGTRDFTTLARLPHLEQLVISIENGVDSLVLPNLPLRRLMITSGRDPLPLDWLCGLSDLVELQIMAFTKMDLSGLAKLRRLKELSVLGVPNLKFDFVRTLVELEKAMFFSSGADDLSPFRSLHNLRHFSCLGGGIADVSPLAELEKLEECALASNRIEDASPFGKLEKLTSLILQSNRLEDVSWVESLESLVTLDISHNPISRLEALAQLKELARLTMGLTKPDDFGFLKDLSNLSYLSFYNTACRDLSVVANLQRLTQLHCQRNELSDLSPLAELGELSDLAIAGNPVEDLGPLARLSKIRSLDCSNTRVTSIASLSGLGQLEKLDCSNSPIDTLAPLSESKTLAELDCSATGVADLEPLSALPNLRDLDVSDLAISTPLGRLLDFPALQRLVAKGTRIPQVPADLLSTETYDNCLPRLRSHFEDLESGEVSIDHVKLILLGNGRVGKTQLSRALLRHRYSECPYDETVPSTHGVRVIRDELALPAANGTGNRQLKVSLWDFGGQDIYHGTHSLFLKSRAIFLLCWSPGEEDRREQVVEGLTHQNRPLAYWVDYVRHLAGADSPLIVVQTQCDRENDAQERRVQELELSGFEFRRTRHFSARTGVGESELRGAIAAAADWMKERHGTALIGRGRMAVLDQLEAWRTADAELPAEERRHKTLSQEEYLALCETAGGISSPQHLLQFLHQAGVIFHHPNLFGDRIILDQNWALEAIYTVFDRQQCYRQLQALGGRFTPGLLASLAWDSYSGAERSLFLSLMTSCGIAFEYREGGYDASERTYIAPDLLPPRAAVAGEIARSWHDDVETVTARLGYKLLHEGLMRQIIADIGADAGINAIYWRGGTCFHEKNRGSNAIIEEVMEESGWAGEIRIACQHGQAAALLDRLVELAGEAGTKMGMTAEVERSGQAQPEPTVDPESKPPPLLPAPFPRGEKERWYVSYAWGDETPEGLERKERVDQLCAEAESRGIELLRDASVLQNGDSIQAFMNSLSRGDRIIVILSEKYLKSPYCMFELYSAWRFQRAEPDRFAEVLRAFRLPDAKISDDFERAAIAGHWRKQMEKFEGLDMRDLSEQGMVRYKLVCDYANRVGDILDMIADRIRPSEWDEFLDDAFAP
jgi:internalin A